MDYYNINIDEAAIYVGTYAKYNDGSLDGKWLQLSDFADKKEFYGECYQLHSDEEDPELMFQDYENIPENMVGECFLSDAFFSLRDALAELCEAEKEPFFIWAQNGCADFEKSDAHDLINSFREDYMGQYNSEEDYTYQFIDDCYELSDFMKSYFDYAKFARDLFITDYWYEEGHVFRRS